MSNKEKIKIIFIGTSNFSVSSLRALLADKDFNILTVITQPDEKFGRKQILTPPPIKKEARKNGLEVWQPEKIKDCQKKISPLKPDLIVVVAYGQIIPRSILDIPRYNCINVHGSLLPRYRGAACVQTPILNGDKKTGITIMKMDAGLDTGPILKQTAIKINSEETAETLHDKLAELGAKILPKTLKDYVAGKIKLKPQDDSTATYVPTLKKENGRINWQNGAKKIERMVRALNPWPGVYTEIKNKKLKIKNTGPKILQTNKYKPGQIFLHDNQLAIQCGQDALIVKEIQLEGKRTMTAKEFLLGHQDVIGQTLK